MRIAVITKDNPKGDRQNNLYSVIIIMQVIINNCFLHACGYDPFAPRG